MANTKLVRVPSSIPLSVIQEAIQISEGYEKSYVFAGSVEDCQKVSEALRMIGLKTWVRGRGTRKPGAVNAKGVTVDKAPGYYRSSAESLKSDLPLDKAESAVVYVTGAKSDEKSKKQASNLAASI